MPPNSTLRNPVEALAEEYAQRLRAGERPSPAEYADKYPELADEIAELFPTIEMMEHCSPVRRSRSNGSAWPTSAVRVPERLGEFRLLREIGRGGMGVVYEAEQSSLGRRVALKVLTGGIATDSTALERFQREAAAAAKLHHTNIVPVFGMGECDGVHFYAMQYIAGKTLRELQRERESAAKELPQSTRLQAGSTARAPAIGRRPWKGARQDPTADFPRKPDMIGR